MLTTSTCSFHQKSGFSQLKEICSAVELRLYSYELSMLTFRSLVLFLAWVHMHHLVCTYSNLQFRQLVWMESGILSLSLLSCFHDNEQSTLVCSNMAKEFELASVERNFQVYTCNSGQMTNELLENYPNFSVVRTWIQATLCALQALITCTFRWAMLLDIKISPPNWNVFTCDVKLYFD